ncbi:hypothetical protein BGZ94_002633 [Podila epigama]|nr:hypothetical protein BGZ94_002633 [Podila epigama]
MPKPSVSQGLHGAANLGQNAFSKGVGFIQEFREFLTKGNAFDLAVAFIISTAISAVIKSLVEDLITPLIGLASNRNLDEMFIVLRCGKSGDGCRYPTRAIAQADGGVTWNWGKFINTVIYLLLVGIFLFLVVKLYYTLRRKTVIKDKGCPYCGKDVPGAAVRCAFCTSWLDHDARRKAEGEFASGNGVSNNVSTTTLGTANGMLREKDFIDGNGVRAYGVAASDVHQQQQPLYNGSQVPGVYGVQNAMINQHQPDEIDYVDHPKGARNGNSASR